MTLKKFFVSFLVTTIMLAGLSALVLYLSFSQFSIFGFSPVGGSMEGRTNILVLGTDLTGQHSDSMMLVSINHDDKAVDLLSIPRDTKVLMDGYYTKINAAHAVGGEDKAVEQVEELLGISIPYYVSLDPSVFREVIDAVGGVHFEVPQRMVYNDPEQNLYIDLEPGYQLLDGDKAEQLVRFRQYTFGDMDRITVQRDFVKAAVEQKLNMSLINKIDDLYEVFSERVITNISISEMIKLVSDIRSLDMNHFRTHVVPCELADSDGISYEIIQDELNQMLVDFFGAEIPGYSQTPEELRGNGTEGNGLETGTGALTEEDDEYYEEDVYYEDEMYYDEEVYYEDDSYLDDGQYYDESGNVYSESETEYYDENGDYYTGE